jgi:four helix bundle protein
MDNQEGRKIKSFRDLDVWRVGHELVLTIYRITKNFPKEEVFGLTSQMRRSAVSVTSNIAEGFSRFSPKEKAHFYSMSKGSLTELHNQLIISLDVGYLSPEEYDFTENLLIRTHMILNKFILSTNRM